MLPPGSDLEEPLPARAEDLDELETEAAAAATTDLDTRTTRELVELMNAEDSTVPTAVRGAAAAIAALVDEIADRVRAGG